MEALPRTGKRTAAQAVAWRSLRAFWALFLLVVVLIFLLHRLFPPDFLLSPAELSFRDNRVVVDFSATNHTKATLSRKLRINIGAERRIGLKGTNAYISIADQRMDIHLLPLETRQLHCEFPIGEHWPVITQAEVREDR